MPKIEPFDAQPDRYDAWFDRHDAVYASELDAVRALWPVEGEGLEVGVGTGRFAVPLGIQHGVDPSSAMRERARQQGIEVKDGVAEDLPYPDERFDGVLMTTTLCYLDDPPQAFREVYRVLRSEHKRGSGLGPRPGGAFVLGFVDRDSPLGVRFERRRKDNVFYRDARFHAAADVIHWLEQAGFTALQARQTLFSDPDTMTAPDPVRDGYGEGGFVVLRGDKPS